MSERYRTRRLWRWGVLLACVLAVALVPVGLVGWRRYARSPGHRLSRGMPEERAWAIKEIAKRGPSAGELERISAALNDPAIKVRLGAIAALARCGGREVASRLAPMLSTDQPLQVRLRALEALAELGGDESRGYVEEALNAPEPEFRALAARHIPRLAGDGAVRLLTPLMYDRSETVRTVVMGALIEVTGAADPDAVRSLVGGRVVWEAERGLNITRNYEIAPSPRERERLPELAQADQMFINLDGWSGDGWIRCLEGAGGNHEWLGGESGSIDIGRITYPIVVPKSGRYLLWARTWLTDKCGDSYYVRFDNGPRRMMEHPWEGVLGEWRLWFWLTDHNDPVYLDAGPHTLYVHPREDGVRIDQFCLMPEGADPPAGALTANVDPLALARDGAHVALSSESVIVDSAGDLHATVRVLRYGAEVRGVLRLDAEDGELDCPASLPVELLGDDRVFVKDITVRLPTDAPCRERVLSAAFRPEGGGEDRVARLLMKKPWPWEIAGPLAAPQNVGRALAGKNVAWQSLPPEKLFNRYGTMDIEKAFGNATFGRIILRTRIRCDEAGTYLWLLNSDDKSVVWLDGRRVIANLLHAPAEGFLTRARVAVSAGEHELVAAVSQATFPDGHIYNGTQNFWLFRLRVRKEEHVPAPIIGLPWKEPPGRSASIAERF